VRVYSLTSFTLLHSITGGHKRSVRSVSWKPGTAGQSVLATGSFDASAGIWRREQPQQEERDKAGEEEGEEGRPQLLEEEEAGSCWHIVGQQQVWPKPWAKIEKRIE